MDEITNDRPAICAEGIVTVQIHLPSYWTQNHAAWFTNVETIFTLRRITTYEILPRCLRTLNGGGFGVLQRCGRAPPPTTTSKRRCCAARVCLCTGVSSSFSTKATGDRRNLCVACGGSSLIVDLFLQRLPQNVVISLATAPDDLSLEKLTELADRVVDYSARGTVATYTIPLSQVEGRQGRLEQLIDDLAETVNALRPASHPRRRDHDCRSRLSPRSSACSSPRRRSYCLYYRNFGASIASWPESVLERVRYNVSPVAFPEPNDKWKYLFKACASQRLFLPSMLPAVDALIYVDSDVMLLSPIEKLWQQFAAMNNSHLVALVPETESNYTNWYLYSAKHPFYKPLGVNSGVMLMNLTRMREFRWEERVLPLQEIYGDKIAWGDQDLINILFSLHPDRLLVLPCRWNYRTDHCMDGTYCDGEAPAVVHGSRNLFLHDNEPAFWALRQAMMQYKLGESLKDGFIAPLKDGLRRGRETPCMQQFLTHLVNWEAVALSVDNATAKSRHS
ncbi:hypothetical protein HPB50_015746 [Hyalomma asiaticum]|uniref:Uncharacterized protein n=1 Tax=Hyalomma asiaticum TaxID=266040 RepID=A0ACB7T590_HYAAI|nr:hypothetical protein HPB50_015746 [Hyalomma asiaticum]